MGKRTIFHPDDAAKFFEKFAGKSYRPSNGTEGEIFEGAWCADCRRDAAFREHYESNGPASKQPEGCPILVNVHAYDADDPNYPKEWRYGSDGQPVCSGFIDKREGDATPRCEATADLFAEALPEVRHVG